MPNNEKVPLTTLAYSGGELWCPDDGHLFAEGPNETSVELVTFHSQCFDEAGAWRPEILLAMQRLINDGLPCIK